ncbi:MAG: hypothetical protein OEL79_07455, partial [Chromatiales bacterium]|nr:hypothetical protein [Chromatiales bacterium]
SEPWQGFYPADLPEDWQLDFYSNEFRAVVIPIHMWQEMSPDKVGEWIDAVHDEFRFYLEASNQSKIENINIELFGEHWGGWVCRDLAVTDGIAPSIWYEGAAEPRQMRGSIENLHHDMGSANRGVIVVNAMEESWEVASDMRQLVELMGYG